MVLLIALLLIQTPPLPHDGCVLEGTVTLTKNGELVSGAELTQLVVYLKDGPPRARPEPQTHTMRQQNFEFQPRSMVVLLNDSVEFVNAESDTTPHSVFSQRGDNPFPGAVNERKTTFKQAFTKEGSVHVQCNIHEWMQADVLVLRSASFVHPDEHGNWRLTGLERRAYTLVAWEPNGGEERRQVSACASGPIQLALVKKTPPLPLRRDGSRYRPEYETF